MPINCGFVDAPQARALLAYYGPTTLVNVGLDPTWAKDQPRAPKPDRTRIPALIDTGAQETCIDSALAVELGLPVINKRAVCGVGQMEVDVYLAQIHIERLRYTITGGFAGIPLIANGVREPVCLGRSFLRDCVLTYDGKTGDVNLDVNL